MTGLIFHHSYTVAPRSCVVNNLSTMTRRKNRFSSLFAGSAKPDSTASTSSPQKLPDHAKRIREAAEAVDEKRVDADLDALFDYISRLSDFIKEEEKEKKGKMKKEEKKKETTCQRQSPLKIPC